MRPIAQFRHLMSSTVTVAPRTALDTGGYAKPTYGTAVAYQAHLSRARTLLRTAVGQQVESLQQVYLATADSILPTAQVTLSTADVGSTEAIALHPTIQAVDRRYDWNGPSHVILYL